jgi:hypothetical protein
VGLVGLAGLIGVYLVGVMIGLIVMRDPWPSRVVTAIAWPLGLVAFVVVLTIMFAAAIYLWPVPLLATAAVAAAIWLAM